MKKKVLIIMPSMFIGGAERSLLGLLDAFDYERYDVSLFLYRHEGDFLPYINKNVTILPEMEEYKTFDVPIKSLLLSNKLRFGVKRLKAKIDQKMHSRKHQDENGIWMHMQMISRNLQSSLPDIPGEYDMGIMFLGIPDTLVNHVKAKVKISWNHTDYMTLHPDKAYDRQIYRHIDHIVSVSEDCMKQFLLVYPELENKAVVIENILSQTLIEEQASVCINDMKKTDNELLLLSVGRYSYAKNFDNVPDICRRILDHKIEVKWFIIGYGGDEGQIKLKIKESGMEENVILLGKRVNPYPYIKNCDVYIQPSRFEGKCVTVREAQILGRPVIITDYATAHDQVKDRYDGFIVPMDNEGCAAGIAELLENTDLLKTAGDNCTLNDYSNHDELLKLVSLAGN